LYVLGHTGIGGTLALTETAVATDAAGEVQLPRARARVHGDGLLDDEAIGNELADGLAGVGVGDLADLIGIEPDLALSAAQDGRRQALLGPQVNPTRPHKSAIRAMMQIRRLVSWEKESSGWMDGCMGGWMISSSVRFWLVVVVVFRVVHTQSWPS